MSFSYGKDMTWQNYSVHDAASAFRRYLNQLPSPVIPFSLYQPFHEAHRECGDLDRLTRAAKGKEPSAADVDASIKRYRDLIKELPPSSQHLLFYILDLLSMFHAKSAENLMPASNLALIFQMGLLRAESSALTTSVSRGPESAQPANLPTGESAAALIEVEEVERKRSQEVLQFLIEHAGSFELEPPASKRAKKPSGPSRSGSSIRLASLAAAITPSRSQSHSSLPAQATLSSSGARAVSQPQPQSEPASTSSPTDETARRKLRRKSADPRTLQTPPHAGATGVKRSNTTGSQASRPSRSPRIPDAALLESPTPAPEPVVSPALQERKGRGWFGKRRQSVNDAALLAASPPKA